MKLMELIRDKAPVSPRISLGQKVGFMLKRPASFMNYLKIKKATTPSETLSHQANFIVLYLTDRCNMKCTWCLREVEESKDIRHVPITDMTLDGFKKILKRFPHLMFLGVAGQGEPFLNPEIFEILEYATRWIYRFHITTNGLPFTESSTRRLLKIPGMAILFSLKGKDGAEFSKISGLPEKEFIHQTENIRRFVRERNSMNIDAHLRLNYVVGRQNYLHMEDAIRLAEDLGVDCIQLDNLVPFDNFEVGKGPLYQDDLEIVQYIEEMKKIPRKVEVQYPTLIKREGFNFYCMGYMNGPGVDAQGNVTGCMRVLTPQPEFGNIFSDTDVLNGSHFKETRRQFLNGEMPTRCKTCVEMSRERSS